MRTSEECRAKAEELEVKASQSAAGPVRDEFAGMAAYWHRLSALASWHETLEAYKASG